MPNTKASILLVEDEENLHETLKLNLEMEGYEVTSAYDGAVALKKISNEFFCSLRNCASIELIEFCVPAILF
jgi:two-component system alkaline phosphatase synthesis response regulator PhoP